jgi:hypothetical protein
VTRPESKDVRWGILKVATVAAVGGVIYAVAPTKGMWGWVSVTCALTLQVLLAPFTYRRVQRVMASDRPVLDGAIAITVLVTILTLGFALIYAVLAERPGEMDGLDTKLDGVYFTVTTLATVGTGDVHAEGQRARAVATVNILVNVIVLAVAVRMLSTVALHQRQFREHFTPGGFAAGGIEPPGGIDPPGGSRGTTEPGGIAPSEDPPT